jgi:hypothetical protein
VTDAQGAGGAVHGVSSERGAVESPLIKAQMSLPEIV